MSSKSLNLYPVNNRSVSQITVSVASAALFNDLYTLLLNPVNTTVARRVQCWICGCEVYWDEKYLTGREKYFMLPTLFGWEFLKIIYTTSVYQQNRTWRDEHTEHNPFLLNFIKSYVKHDLKERQSKSCGRGERTPRWGSWLPTLWSGGTPLSPAGTVVHGSWEAHRKPRHRPAPGQSEPRGGASGQAGCSNHQCTPTSGHWSQDAHRHEPWTHQKSARQRPGVPLISHWGAFVLKTR